ncbi:hypothetical protein LEN26_020064 [Aphanomyces euteiches]|nr:hypothetical protein LEN26_020064 [Aphanomyces euteiches]
MLRHLLAREDIDEKRIKKLEAKGIRSLKKMLQMSEWDLAHIMDVSVDDLQNLLQRIATKDSPAPTSAMDMFLKSVNFPSALRTTLPDLDNALYGGIPTGMITEFAGIAGLGKSQMCMMLAVLCTLEYNDCAVFYLDSGGNFSAKRFMEMAQERLSARQYASNANRMAKVEVMAKQVHVIAVENLDRLQTRIHELHEFMPILHGKMIIIDSLATLAKNSSTDMSVAQRQMLLMNIAGDLKLLASTYDAYVVTSNHTSTRKDEMGLYSQPALGLAWSHCVTNRIVMEKSRVGLAMTVHKSTVSGHVSIAYSIGTAGLQPPDFASTAADSFEDIDWDDTILEALDESVVEQRMHPIEHASQRDTQESRTKDPTPSIHDEKMQDDATEVSSPREEQVGGNSSGDDIALNMIDDIVPESEEDD